MHMCMYADTHLKHVCIYVMRVFHNDRVAPGQCIGDTVMAFVAKCLPKEKTLLTSINVCPPGKSTKSTLVIIDKICEC